MNKIAFVFSGQGSQYIGMGKNLYKNFNIAKRTFEEANETLGFDISKLCFEGDSIELSQTKNTQPAILTISIAQLRVYMSEIGIEPTYLAGHSLGEYSALVCSESIKFSDALKLVRLRGMLMQEQGEKKKGLMVAIRNIDEEVIKEEIEKISSKGKIVNISNYNGNRNIVVSGEVDGIQMLSYALKQREAEIINLKVSSAFHSPMMEDAATIFESEINKCNFYNPKYIVLSNINGLPYRDKYEITDTLSKQIVKPVNWNAIMKYLDKNKTNISIEFGPKATLRNLIRNNIPNIKAYSYDKEDDVIELKSNMQKKQYIPNKRLLVSRCLGIAVCTKNHNYDNEQYKKGVIDTYEVIEKINQDIVNNENEPTLEQMHIAVEMLKTIFKTKKTPENEQIERFEQLFSETNTKDYFINFKI